MCRVLPLAYSDLAATVDRSQFEADGMSYLHKNGEEISTDVGFVLAQFTKQISEWMKHNIGKQFVNCIPPSPKVHLVENSISEETIAQMVFLHGLSENATSN